MSETELSPLVIGWRERVAIRDWGIKRVRAKIDTGARTSALHVSRIEELDGGRIGFEVVVRERPERVTRWVEADLARESVVRPSSGKRQRRPVVQTTIVIGPLELEAEISLVCRQGMLCRMLIGRKAIEGRAVVDPSRRYVVSASPGSRKRKKRNPA